MLIVSRMVTVVLILVVCAATVHGYLQVRVNRMLIKGWDGTTENVEYFYEDGDFIDLWCLKSRSKGDITLSYDFGDEHTRGKGTARHMAKTADGFLGLRTTLRAEHNGRIITCQLTAGTKYKINVKLVENYSSDGLINLKLNSMMSRYQQPTRQRSDIYYTVEYAFMRNERVTLECQTEDKSIALKTFRDSKWSWNTTIVDTSTNVAMDCEALNNSMTLRKVNVRLFRDFSYILADNLALTVNTSNSLLELYEHRNRQKIFYDFYDGEILVLNCSTKASNLNQNYVLIFGEIENRENNSIIKRIDLNSRLHKKWVNCSLVDTSNNSTVRHISIQFHMKHVAIEYEHWFLAAACLVVGVIFVAISAVVCYVRRRKSIVQESSGEENSQAQLRDENAIIPPYPPQWEPLYAVVNRFDDTTYSNVQKQGHTYCNISEVAASNEGVPTSNLIYADLDIPSSREVPRRFCSEESPYAEVYHNNTGFLPNKP